MIMIDVPVCVKRFATQGLGRSTTCHMFVLIPIRHEPRHNNDFVFDKLDRTNVITYGVLYGQMYWPLMKDVEPLSLVGRLWIFFLMNQTLRAGWLTTKKNTF